MPNGRVLIDSARCKGCGRCVATCPTGAINLQLEEEVDTLAVLLDRIARRTDIGLAEERLIERAGDLRP
jgi:Fe-S-cluster-containing hydrogenase component 2